MAGRTHGMHAEPTTFGAKFALWALQADRDRQRLRRRPGPGGGGQAVGGGGDLLEHRSPGRGATSARRSGSTPVPATQVIARDRHAEYLWACASVGATIELIATEIRHLARSELGEVEEPFKPGQKGSSAMPHKRNPILSERLCGLARVLRGYLSAGLEDVALWHERDISHSSVERVVLPDACLLTLLHAAEGHRPGRGAGRPPRAGAGQPDRRDPSAWSSASPCCWPWSAAGIEPGRRLPDRAARRPGGLGGGAAVPAGARRGPRGHAVRRAQLDEAFDLPRAFATSTGSPMPWRSSPDDHPPRPTRTADRCCSRARSASSTTPATAGC